MTTKTIAVIICYFGNLPWYFKFFAESCRHNPSIDFFLFTDVRNSEISLPKNLKEFPLNLAEFSKITSDKFDLDIHVKNGYKICDFRPSFGMIFEEWVKDYDFWGYGDLDVIYGDIRSFFTDELLETHNVLSVRTEYVTGFFSLFRNDYHINRLFMESPDYKRIFVEEKYLGFDECGLLCMNLINGSMLEELESEIKSITHVIKENKVGSINGYFDFHAIEGVPGRMKWSNGRLIYDQKFEALLYHLISFKCHPLLEEPDWVSVPDIFFINEFSFSKNSPD